MNLLRRLLRLGADHPITVLALLVAATLLALTGIARLTVDTGFARFADRDRAEHQAYLHIAREFGSDRRSYVYVQDDALWTPAKLEALARLHDALWQLPFVERIEDLLTTPAVQEYDGQPNIQPLLAVLPRDTEEAALLRSNAQASPLAAHYSISADGTTVAIGLAVRESDAGRGTEVFAAIEEVIAQARTSFARVEQIGAPRLEVETAANLRHDLYVLLPAMTLVLLVSMYAFCRSKFATFVALFAGILALLWTFGMMGFSGIPAGMLSLLIPPIVAVICVTEIMRMTSGYYRGQHAAAEGGAERASEIMADNRGVPAMLSWLTAAMGLAGGYFSGIPAVRDFGMAAAFAIFANGVIAVLLVPALYAMRKQWQPRSPAPVAGAWVATVAATAARLMQRRQSLWALPLGVVLAIVAAVQLPALRVSNEPFAVLQARHSMLQLADAFHDKLSGIQVFYVTLDGNAEGAFRDPANLQRLADIQAFLEKQDVFDRSLSLADLVSQVSQAAAGGRADAYHVPSSRKLVAQHLLLYPAQTIEPYVSHDFRRANIVVRHDVHDSATLNHHLNELREAAAHLAGPGMTVAIVGEGVLVNAAGTLLRERQALIISFLLGGVSVLLTLMFTSVRGGLVAFATSALAALLVFAAMRLFAIPLNQATAVVALLAAAVAVGGTSHLFTRYSELCRNAASYEEAVTETMRNEVPRMLAMSFGLAMICGVLTLSDFAPVAQFGFLAGMAMLLATVVNLLVIPLGMARTRLVGLYEILVMSMAREELERSPLFQGMTGYEIRKTILLSELHEFAAGDCLIEQDSIGRSMYLVVNGQLEVLRKSHRVTLLEPGDVFGEIGFVDAALRTASVRAITPVSVLRFDHDRMKRDLLLFPYLMAKLNFNISGILGRRLAEYVAAEGSQAASEKLKADLK